MYNYHQSASSERQRREGSHTRTQIPVSVAATNEARSNGGVLRAASNVVWRHSIATCAAAYGGLGRESGDVMSDSSTENIRSGES